VFIKPFIYYIINLQFMYLLLFNRSQRQMFNSGAEFESTYWSDMPVLVETIRQSLV